MPTSEDSLSEGFGDLLEGGEALGLVEEGWKAEKEVGAGREEEAGMPLRGNEARSLLSISKML